MFDRANITADQAVLQVTYARQQGELPDPVPRDSTPEQVKAWVQEGLRAGSFDGIAADPSADVTDYVVDFYDPTPQRPYSMVAVRPKAEFGEGLTITNACEGLTITNALGEQHAPIVFWVEDDQKKRVEILRFERGGDCFVRGEKVDSNPSVYKAMREWMEKSGILPVSA